jgi:hypothetical protein
VRSLWRRLGLLALVAFTAVLLVDWLWTSDKDRVVAALDEMQTNLEARDVTRLGDRFAAEVALDRPVPFLPSGRPLRAALAAVLPRLEGLSLSREETKIEFPSDGVADVVTSGHGGVRIREGAAPFRFDLHLELAKEPDGLFRLRRVVSANVDLGF